MGSVLKVKGMSCQHCVMSVTKALNQLDGIKNVQIDLAKGEVRFDNQVIHPIKRPSRMRAMRLFMLNFK
jgi:copper chaperone CopZ